MNKGNMQSVNLDTSKTNRSSFSAQKSNGSFNPFSGINAILVNNNAISLLFDVTPKMVAAGENKHSTSVLNDKNDMCINEVASFNGDLKNAFFQNPKNLDISIFDINTSGLYYSMYIQYIEGKSLNELVDPKTGYLKEITKAQFADKGIFLSDEEVAYINSVITEFYFMKLDEQIINMNYKVHDVANYPSGYNAVVLTYEKDGQTFANIISAETDSKETEDLAMIANALIPYVFGNGATTEQFDIIMNFLIENPELYNSIIASLNSDGTIPKDIVNLIYEREKVYYNQLADAEKLFLETAEYADGIELNGYSLGGGITLTNYAIIKEKYPELAKKITSVCVYNPYIGLMDNYKSKATEKEIEQRAIEIICDKYGWDSSQFSNLDEVRAQLEYNYIHIYGGEWHKQIIKKSTITEEIDGAKSKAKSELNTTGKDIANSLATDEKVTIYMANGDIVSMVSDNFDVFYENGRIVCFDAEIKPAEDGEHFFSYIIGSQGNHSLNEINSNNNEEIYDEFGNIKTTREPDSLPEIMKTIFGDIPPYYNLNGQTKYTINKDDFLEYILQDDLDVYNLFENWLDSITWTILDKKEITDEEYKILKKEFVKPIIKFIINNISDLDKDELVEVIVDNLNDWLSTDEGQEFFKKIIPNQLVANGIIITRDGLCKDVEKLLDSMLLNELLSLIKIFISNPNMEVGISTLRTLVGNYDGSLPTLSLYLLAKDTYDKGSVVKEETKDFLKTLWEDIKDASWCIWNSFDDFCEWMAETGINPLEWFAGYY